MDDNFQTFFSNEEPDVHPVNEAAKEFVTKFQEWIEEHEAEVHDGDRCPDERANMIAWIVHRIGMTAEDWDRILPFLEYYEQEHDKHAHS